MKIYRRGSQKDHGSKSISLDEPKIELSANQSFVSFAQWNVKDFSGASQHDYTVTLRFRELASAIQVVADAAVKDPESFEKYFEPVLKSLIRLQAVAAGTIGPRSAGTST